MNEKKEEKIENGPASASDRSRQIKDEWRAELLHTGSKKE